MPGLRVQPQVCDSQAQRCDSGNCAEGRFAYSLNFTDIQTAWVETGAILGKGKETVREALEEIREQPPFPLLGIDSDNGSEFINDCLWNYCKDLRIQFTRDRPYKKDDNAHTERNLADEESKKTPKPASPRPVPSRGRAA